MSADDQTPYHKRKRAIRRGAGVGVVCPETFAERFLGALARPVSVRVDGKRERMSAEEVAILGRIQAMCQGDINAIRALLKMCADVGLLNPPPAPQNQSGVLVVYSMMSQEDYEAYVQQCASEAGRV